MLPHECDQIVELLVAYWQKRDLDDRRTRHRCRQVADKVIHHLPISVSAKIRSDPQAYKIEIREVLISLMAKSDPATRKLIRSLTKSEAPARQQVSVEGQDNIAVVIGGDVFGGVAISGQAKSDQQPVSGLKKGPAARTHLDRLRWLLTIYFGEKELRALEAGPESAKQAQLTTLRQMLSEHFNGEELRTLCFDLGIDYDDLPAQGKVNKARELIAHLERQGRIADLVRAGK